MADFSVVIVGRNEEKTLPRLLASLKGIDDIVYMDTGSQDRSCEIAESFYCKVVKAGDQFRKIATQEQHDEWVKKYGYEPSFKVGEGYFHFSEARNHAMTFAKNDWCFMPDCDEEVEWDLDKVKAALDNEDHLVYRFCYAVNPDGTCGLEFTHCKFFRKSKLHWVKWVHEVEAPLPGQNPKPPKYVDFIYHRHFQNKETKRGNYLAALELSILENENDDRNTFYLGREYLYEKKYETSIKFFEKGVKVIKWLPELGQAYIFMGDCYRYLGNSQKALECYHDSLKYCDTRREPWYELATLHEELGNLEQAVIYFRAARAVQFKAHGYLNNMHLYGSVIHDRLAHTYYKMGNKEDGKKAWIESLKLNPDRRILSNIAAFYDCPKISIVVPTCRPEGYERLERSIKENTVYPNYEIIKKDGPGTAVAKFNEGVNEAKGKLIVFIADDCEVRLGWLEQAFVCLRERFGNKGLVVFNDGHWNGTLANHFLCTRNLTEELDGEIWHSGYTHNSVDVELCCRLRAKNLIGYAPDANIIHHHYFCNSKGEEKNTKDKWYEKIEENCLKDRLLLPRRLWGLGLKKDACTFIDMLLNLDGYPKVHESVDLRRIFTENDVFYQDLNVLNIGLGDGGSALAQQLPHFYWKKITHIEIHKPFIEKAKQMPWHSEAEYLDKDITKFRAFDDYDLILAFDVLEHLEKSEALKVLDRCEKTGARIFIFIPLENKFREHGTGVETYDHKSLWMWEEFESRGYKTVLLPNFHTDGKERFPALWAIK